MRGPLRPVAPSLGDAAGRPRNGPVSNGPELPPSQETGEVRSRAILFHRIGQPSTPAREGAEDKMKTSLLRTAFLLIAVSVLSFSLQAQTNPPDAHLSGRLTDLSGYGIGNVKVTAKPSRSPIFSPPRPASASRAQAPMVAPPRSSSTAATPASRKSLSTAHPSILPAPQSIFPALPRTTSIKSRSSAARNPPSTAPMLFPVSCNFSRIAAKRVFPP